LAGSQPVVGGDLESQPEAAHFFDRHGGGARRNEEERGGNLTASGGRRGQHSGTPAPERWCGNLDRRLAPAPHRNPHRQRDCVRTVTHVRDPPFRMGCSTRAAALGEGARAPRASPSLPSATTAALCARERYVPRKKKYSPHLAAVASASGHNVEHLR
jgi:hypothetical protein